MVSMQLCIFPQMDFHNHLSPLQAILAYCITLCLNGLGRWLFPSITSHRNPLHKRVRKFLSSVKRFF